LWQISAILSNLLTQNASIEAAKVLLPWTLGIPMKNTRRTFFMTLAAGCTLLSSAAHGQAKVDEKDPQAVALGYLADATKVDAKKYPAHKPTQMCSNCALYQGKPADAAGACPLFAGKQVSSKGWCSAYAPKAA
jgi:hypothetical protein